MKKSKLFDIIVYRILFSIPVSCVANLVYGFALFFAFWVLDDPSWFSFTHFEYLAYSVFLWLVAVTIFVLFNMMRYLAIKSGHLKYGIIGLILSSVPEYLSLILWVLYMYIIK